MVIVEQKFNKYNHTSNMMLWSTLQDVAHVQQQVVQLHVPL